MNITRSRASDPPAIAEDIMRRMTPAEWIKVFVLIGGFVVGFFTLRAQNEERWINQRDRDDKQEKAVEQLKAEVNYQLGRINDKQDKTLEILGGRR